MASGKCGTASVTYDKQCDYSCWCSRKGGCVWTVTCPGPNGKDITTSGTGLVKPPPSGDDRPTHITFDGRAASFAEFILEHSGRHVDVPRALAGKRVTIDVRGGVAAALRAAGFNAST